jgi:hypothetical protein
MAKYDAIFEGRLPKRLMVETIGADPLGDTHGISHIISSSLSSRAIRLKKWCSELAKLFG